MCPMIIYYILALLIIYCRFIVNYYICKKLKKIEKDKLNIDLLRETFKDRETLNTDDIVLFYKSLNPTIKDTTINWRIYSLVQSGILTRTGRGKFIIGSGMVYRPEISKKIITLHSKVKKKFPFLQTCFWSTAGYNELMLHQPGWFYILVEVEKDALESVFFFLKELKYSVFIEPSEEIMESYFPYDKETLIVKQLVSEAPLQKIAGVSTVTLEKMLVDAFCGEVAFEAQQGSEMRNIFREAISKYVINENRLFRYASRRNRRETLKEYYDSVRTELLIK
jgi:hypothetical protein